MSNLQQLQLTYDPLQDRLILFIYTQDFQEYRFWMTRRCTLLLWELLMKLINASQKDQLQVSLANKKVHEQIEKEKIQQQSTPAKLATKLTTKPLGEEPILIASMAAKPGENGTWHLRLDGGKGLTLEIGGDHTIALALCDMIHQTSTAAQWQLPLQTSLLQP